MYCITTEQKRARVRRAWECAENDGTLRDFAKLEGVTSARITIWVRGYPELRERFLSNPHKKKFLSEDRSAQRAFMVAEFRLGRRTLTSVAREEGVSPAAIHYWAKRHEDEVWEAMLDLERRAA
jgi:hypothetical protein